MKNDECNRNKSCFKTLCTAQRVSETASMYSDEGGASNRKKKKQENVHGRSHLGTHSTTHCDKEVRSHVLICIVCMSICLHESVVNWFQTRMTVCVRTRCRKICLIKKFNDFLANY